MKCGFMYLKELKYNCFVLAFLGHDWSIIRLGLKGEVMGFDVDTAFFTGNNSPHVSIEGIYLDSEPVRLINSMMLSTAFFS